MATQEKKVLGLTIKQLQTMQDEILGWVDSNHPYIEVRGQGDNDGFRLAFEEGAALLNKTPNAKSVFSKIHSIGKGVVE